MFTVLEPAERPVLLVTTAEASLLVGIAITETCVVPIGRLMVPPSATVSPLAVIEARVFTEDLATFTKIS